MSTNRIEFIKIRGFRSLADVELSGMPQATVLIGANGSGKSNFMRFLDMLSWMLSRPRRLQEYVQRQGGADDQLFGGSATTPSMEAEIRMRAEEDWREYGFALAYSHPDRFTFTDERFRVSKVGSRTDTTWHRLDSGHVEARILETAQSPDVPEGVRDHASLVRCLMSYWEIFRFYDTSKTSSFMMNWDVSDNRQLRRDGGNLAAVLYRLEQEDLTRYETICRQIGRVLPGFDRFEIEEANGKVLLRWQSRWSDKSFGAHLTSDGSLRFFALLTLLNLPPNMLPDVIMLDEPELGLHPAAIALVGGLIKSLSAERQVIVATQSPLLVDAFDLDEIFVLDLEEGRTICRKLDAEDYRHWLNDGYSAGELWRMNLLGGRP